MADIFNVAEYILERHGPMSPMKLQKLCYYAQAWALAWDGTPLFQEDFRAWETGPVCPELYGKTQDRHRICPGSLNGSSGELTDGQKDAICRVLAHYGGHDAAWLGQLSMMEAPWIMARQRGPEACGQPGIILKENMARYYRGLSENARQGAARPAG